MEIGWKHTCAQDKWKGQKWLIENDTNMINCKFNNTGCANIEKGGNESRITKKRTTPLMERVAIIDRE